MRKLSVRIVVFLLLLATGSVLAADGTVFGILLNERGEAIPKAQLLLAAGNEQFRLESDTQGKFHFASLPQGSAVLLIQKDGYRTQQLDLEVGEGEEIRITLEPLPRNPGTLAGQVLDRESSRGIQNAKIAAKSLSTGFESPVTSTDSKGYWQLNLAPGQYTIVIQHLHYETQEANVEVVSGEVRTLTFKLNPITLPLANIYGQVQTKGSIPIANVRVKVTTEDLKLREKGTDNEGVFQFSAVLPGRGLVTVSKEGYLTWLKEVEFIPGEQLALKIFLEPEPLGGAFVFGQVKDMKTGRSVTFAKISALDFNDLSELQTTLTDHGGSYKLFLSPGSYVLKVEHPDYFPKPEPIELASGQNLQQELLIRPAKQEPSILVGKIHDSQSLAIPLGDARVTLTGDIGTYRGKTGEDGWFEIAQLEPGRYTLKIQKAGFESYQQKITIPAGEKIQRIIPLTKIKEPLILD